MTTTRILIGALVAALAVTMILTSPAASHDTGPETISVSGSGTDLANSAIIHSEESTTTGVIKRVTEIISLTGDLNGYVLYQPTQTFDYTNNTLVVTGTQFFSGTIAGSDPVILYDDQFRFDVNLATGEETGEVHLRRSNDAPDNGHWYECDLVVVGTGLTTDGNPTFDYSGSCTLRRR